MPPFYLSALKQNLIRLCWIRCILLAVECIALAYAYGIDLPLPYGPIGGLLLLSFVIILLSYWRAGARRRWAVSEREFGLHLFADTALLSGLLYLAGGASNPFVSLLLIPLTISAALLPALYTRLLTLFAVACYSALLFFFDPLDILAAHSSMSGTSAHVVGMWFTFLLSAALITYFITRMAQALREQERSLQRAREETLRDEHIMAVATLAAGAAHELATPLSTMRVLLTELERNPVLENEDLLDDIVLLGEQVERCKDILHDIVQSARSQSTAPDIAVPTAQFLSQLLDKWRSLFPEIRVRATLSQDVDGTSLRNTSSLNQALMNLLNNAGTVSTRLDIDVRRDADRLLIALRDYGPGLSPELLARAGRTPLHSSDSGLGLGLFLTHATLERIGGSVRMANHTEGGAITQVFVPFADC